MNPTSKPTPDNRLRVLRGGRWNSRAPSWVRAASRDAVVPASRLDILGFRTHLPVRQPRV